MRNVRWIGVFLAALIAAGTVPAQAAKEQKPVFLSGAGREAALTAATAKAAKKESRVLVVSGRGDDAASEALAASLKRDKALGRLVLYEYVVVLEEKGVTPAAEGSTSEAMPSLRVLDGKGGELGRLGPEASLADGKPAAEAIAAFLKEHKATPRKAEAVLDEARQRAAESGRRVFVHLGAPW